MVPLRFSSENNFIVIIGSMNRVMILWFVGFASNFVGPELGALIKYLSVMEHFTDFAKGVIDSSHMVFYLSFAFFSLFLTYQAVESTKWRG